MVSLAGHCLIHSMRGLDKEAQIKYYMQFLMYNHILILQIKVCQLLRNYNVLAVGNYSYFCLSHYIAPCFGLLC